MANIITSGTTEADSSEFTLASGESATIFLTGSAPANAVARVKIKAADASFSTIGELTNQYPAKVLAGAGTYKVTRAANAVAFGVDKV
jgi:hypothetical protein